MTTKRQRLVESIYEANHRCLRGEADATVNIGSFADSLPIIALTCIDPRLNRLLPNALGVPEHEFIWLRNAGNIIFAPDSTMMRTLALACAVKKGKEIIILGHTDCGVRKTSVLELTERFKELGIDRAQLPGDLVDFFGLFASERQNVMKGVSFARRSPLIGPRVPVHGMLIDIQTGALEWVVNGYEALDAGSPNGEVGAPTALGTNPPEDSGSHKRPLPPPLPHR